MIAATLCRISDAICGEMYNDFAATPGEWSLVMAIADWIREATERRRQRLRREGRIKGLSEGYLMGYDDADKGRPRGFSLDALDKSGKKRKTE